MMYWLIIDIYKNEIDESRLDNNLFKLIISVIPIGIKEVFTTNKVLLIALIVVILTAISTGCVEREITVSMPVSSVDAQETKIYVKEGYLYYEGTMIMIQSKHYNTGMVAMTGIGEYDSITIYFVDGEELTAKKSRLSHKFTLGVPSVMEVNMNTWTMTNVTVL